MTTAEQLYGIPEPIQEQLVRIYRLAAGMSNDEKTAARATLAGVTLAHAMTASEEQFPAAEMIAALARIVTTADQLATTGKVA
jgi:hypothetical protein